MTGLDTDLGEKGANDSTLLQLVSSVDITCGLHAGDARLMVQSVRKVLKYGVVVGAHPGCPDRENFGYTTMDLPPGTAYAWMLCQIDTLAAIVQAQGDELQCVKPHGILYNQTTGSPLLADAIARATRDASPKLVLVGLAGNKLIHAGWHYGLTTRQEASADRGYLADGSLVPHSQPGALIDSEEQVLAQAPGMVQYHRMRSIDGEQANVVTQAMCLRSDGPHALDSARRLRAAFVGCYILVSAQLNAGARQPE